MQSVPRALSDAPESPFKFVGGDLSVDFVNTVDWSDRGLLEERLTDYDRLLEWAEDAEIVSAMQAGRLRARAARVPREAQQALAAAYHVRWVLRCLLESLIVGKRASDALNEFNALLLDVYQRLVLAWPREGSARARDAAGPALQWEWRDMDERLEAVLWPVVRAAAALLTSGDAAKLRICGGPDCGWMYVDRSRNGLRRWCEMSVCGTREKSRRRSVRRRKQSGRRRSRAGA